MQWRYKAVNPPGVALPDGDIMSDIYFKVKELYEKQGGPMKEALTKLTWPYGHEDRQWPFPLRSPYGGQGDQRFLP